MEKLTSKTALFPGCSLEGTASAFHASLVQVFGALDIPCEELRDWSCCGASSAHALDHDFCQALNLRNLALAETQGYASVLAPCAACYHRLALTQLELESDPERLAALNAETGLEYSGAIAVRNVLDILANDVGTEAIAARVTQPLSGLKVACYYGCLNTRIPRMEPFDDREYPMAMDRVVQRLGAQPIDWSYKTDCCGASLFATSGAVSARLAAKILEDAIARGADCISVTCPMCHNNLDTKQEAIREQYNLARPLPVLFLTQLMGLAFGLDPRDLKLHHSFVPFEALGR